MPNGCSQINRYARSCRRYITSTSCRRHHLPLFQTHSLDNGTEFHIKDLIQSTDMMNQSCSKSEAPLDSGREIYSEAMRVGKKKGGGVWRCLVAFLMPEAGEQHDISNWPRSKSWFHPAVIHDWYASKSWLHPAAIHDWYASKSWLHPAAIVVGNPLSLDSGAACLLGCSAHRLTNVSFVVVNRRPPTWMWIGVLAASAGRLANGIMGSCVWLESDVSAMMAAGWGTSLDNRGQRSEVVSKTSGFGIASFTKCYHITIMSSATYGVGHAAESGAQTVNRTKCVGEQGLETSTLLGSVNRRDARSLRRRNAPIL